MYTFNFLKLPAHPRKYLSNDPRRIHKTYHQILSEENFPREIQFGFRSTLITDPQTVGKVLKYLPKSKIFYDKLSKPVHGAKFLDEGILTAKGEDAKNQRKNFEMNFNRSILESFEPFMYTEANALIDKFPNSGYVDVKDYCKNVTTNIVGKTLLGDIFDTQIRKYIINDTVYLNEEIVKYINPLYSSRTVIPSYQIEIINKTVKIRNTLKILIKNRNNNDSCTELLDVIIKSSKNEEQALDNILTFFLAGYDTTASALTICIQLIFSLKNHSIYKNILDEVNSVTNIHEMKYLDNFIKEVLRLHPPSGAGMLREYENSYSHHFCEYNWADGNNIIVPVYSLQRHPDYWEFPDVLFPERWEKIKEINVQNIYLPFSIGPRNCIGKYLALMELKVILSILIKRIEVSYISDTIYTTCTPVLENAANVSMYIEKKH